MRASEQARPESFARSRGFVLNDFCPQIRPIATDKIKGIMSLALVFKVCGNLRNLRKKIGSHE